MKYARKRSSKTTGKQAGAVAKAAKRILLRAAESKYFAFDFSSNVTSETFWSFSPTQQIINGTAANARIGDTILLQNLILSGEWTCAAAILNVKYRMIVGWSRAQTSNTTLTTGILDATSLFYPVSSGQVAHRVVNPAIFTTLYDEMIDINSNTTTGADVRSFYVDINLRMKQFKYANNGSALGKTQNLFVVILPMLTAAGAVSGTTTGSIRACSVLRFKDP